MEEDILNLVKQITSAEVEAWLLKFAIDKTTNRIKSNCNVSEIPQELYETSVAMAAGEILMIFKTQGKLDKATVEAPVKSLKVGDTQINYAITDNDEDFTDNLINSLLQEDFNFNHFRRLRW